MKYAAFISYSHRDANFGAWLHKSLETYKVPKYLIGSEGRDGAVPARLGTIFRDREELPTSSDLGSVIVEALRQSRYLIVICSPHSAKSKWVNEEIISFKRQQGEGNILALIVDGEPGSSIEECFPDALKYKLGNDGELSTEETEPIAADIRSFGDGKNNAKLKLIAGLLGVSFNSLKRRELVRRRKRIAGTGTALVSILWILSFLLLSLDKQIGIIEETQAGAYNRVFGEDGEPPEIFKATFYGELDVIEASLQGGVSINETYGKSKITPLILSAILGDQSTFRWLVENGADMDYLDFWDMAAIHHAAYHGRAEMMEVFADLGIDLNTRAGPKRATFRPIDIAAENSQVSVVRSLHKLGVPFEHREGDLNDHPTPLFPAAAVGSIDSVEVLLELGIDPHIPKSRGQTAYDEATIGGHDECIQRLAEAMGLDDSAMLGKSLCDTLMMFGVHYDVSRVKELLARGADPNYLDAADDDYRRSALHFAIKNYIVFSKDETVEPQLFECIRLLLEAGADPNWSDEDSRGRGFSIRKEMRYIDETKLLTLMKSYGYLPLVVEG